MKLKAEGPCKAATWALDGQGYGHTSTLRQHIEVWKAAYGPVPVKHEIDHICGNKWCIELTHLQAVPHRVNNALGVQRNKSKQSSKYLGVTLDGGRWKAAIKLRSGKTFNIGRFASQKEAAKAYDYVALSEYGQDTITNESLGNFKKGKR